jgi:hypothetical protein
MGKGGKNAYTYPFLWGLFKSPSVQTLQVMHATTTHIIMCMCALKNQ